MECDDFRLSAHCPVRAAIKRYRFILLLFIGDQRLSFKMWWLLSRSPRQHNGWKKIVFQNDMRRNGRHYYYKIQSINGHLHGRTMIFFVRYQIFTQQHTLWNNNLIFVWWMLIVCIFDAERHMPARIVAHFHLISVFSSVNRTAGAHTARNS